MRRATHDDVPMLLKMGEAMHKESRFRNFRFNCEKVTAFFHAAVENRSCILLVHGDPVHAMLVAYVESFWWGDDLESNDLLLYVVPEMRGKAAAVRLVNEYKRIAVEMEVSDIKIGASSGVEHDRTVEFFERMGFRRFAANCALPESVH